MRKFLFILLKVFTYNLCDSCGFTRDDVYFTHIFQGRVQCKKCFEDGL